MTLDPPDMINLGAFKSGTLDGHSHANHQMRWLAGSTETPDTVPWTHGEAVSAGSRLEGEGESLTEFRPNRRASPMTVAPLPAKSRSES